MPGIYHSVLEKKNQLLSDDLTSFVTEALYQTGMLYLTDLPNMKKAYTRAKQLLKVAERYYYLVGIVQARILKTKYTVLQNELEEAKERAIDDLATAKTICNKKKDQKDYKIARRVLAEVYITSGWIKYLSGHLDDAVKDYTEALVIAEGISNRKLIYLCFKELARCYQNQGFHDRALSGFEKAYTLARDNDDIKEALDCQTYLAYQKRYLGKYEEALATSLESYTTAQRYNLDVTAILQNLALLEFDIGNYKSAQDYYAEALEVLGDSTPWCGQKAILIGNRAQVYFANGHFSQAKKMFNLSIELYEKSGIEIGLVEQICNYIKLLVNMGFAGDEKTGKLLAIAKTLAKKHRSVYEELHYNYAKAIVHKGKENFGLAKEVLRKQVIDSSDYQFYEIYVNINLTLAELYLERFKRLQLTRDYNNTLNSLNNAEKAAREANLVPKVVQILLVKAQLKAVNLKFDQAFKILDEARFICEQNNLMNLHLQMIETRTIITDKEILVQERSVSPEAITEISVDEVLFQFSSKRYSDLLKEFSIDDFYVTVFKQDVSGPEVFITEELPFERAKDMLMPIGVLYSTVIGQGNRHNEGLFGPLPVGDFQNYIALIFSKSMYDSMQLDERMEKHSYTLFCLLYHKKFSKLFYNRDFILHAFERKVAQVDDIQNLNQGFLSELKQVIFDEIIMPS